MSFTPAAGLQLVSYNLRQGGSVGAGNSWQKLLSELDAYGEIAGCAHQLVPHGKWGTAILSRRYALEQLPVPEFEGWVVGARIHGAEVGGEKQDLDVFSVHIPSPGPYEPRVDRQIDVLRDHGTERLRIVAGDFNITVSMRHAKEKMQNTPGEKRIQQRLRG